MNETPARRIIHRMTVEVFEDQVDALKDIHHRAEGRKPTSMNAMVREAIDDYIAKHREK